MIGAKVSSHGAKLQWQNMIGSAYPIRTKIGRSPRLSTIGGLMQSETPRSRTSTSRSQSSSSHRSPVYSVEVADAPEIPGEGKPRRHPLAADGTVTDTFEEGIYTLYDTFKNACTKYGNA